MLILIIFGIFLFPKISAEDEIKIYQNKSIHWKRHCEVINQIDEGKCSEAKNTGMEYIIDSPDTSEIGKLVKETKIEGCQHVGGCTLILKLGTLLK